MKYVEFNKLLIYFILSERFKLKICARIDYASMYETRRKFQIRFHFLDIRTRLNS